MNTTSSKNSLKTMSKHTSLHSSFDLFVFKEQCK